MGWLIIENAIIAFELLHSFQRKGRSSRGNFILKLDMSKAYDRVEWHLVQAVMVNMGFDEHWVELLMRCVRMVPILVNGEARGILSRHVAYVKKTL